MTSITIALPDDIMDKLQALAKQRQVKPEDLVRASVEELVTAPQTSFEEALEHVLQKNQELYRRLAA